MRHLLSPGFVLSLLSALLTAPLAATPPTAHLQVRTDTGAATFHLGERIPLQLDFTASLDDHLYLAMNRYDRSGRMHDEIFTVSPSSAAMDPLATYFSSGYAGGGLSSGPQQLSLKPITLHLDLNEWVRFDHPGDYTVTVHSTRVSATGNTFQMNQDDPVPSNPITLHLVPATSAWQKTTLTRALQVLAEPANPNTVLPPQRAAAIADIRFLATPAAIAVMANNLGDAQTDRNAPFGFGLIGLPPALHDLAILCLEQVLNDPDTAVSSWQITALAELLSGSAGTPQAQVQARLRARTDVVHMAFAALPRKTDKARLPRPTCFLQRTSPPSAQRTWPPSPRSSPPTSTSCPPSSRRTC